MALCPGGSPSADEVDAGRGSGDKAAIRLSSASAHPPQTLWELFAGVRGSLSAWIRLHRALFASFFGLIIALIAYSVYRATYLSTSDLVRGYLTPTRGILFGGKDPYVDYVFNSFSPFFYSVLAPLALMNNGWASLFWACLNLFFLGGIVAITQALIRAAMPEQTLAPAWLAIAMALAFIADNFFLGQSNLLPLFLICCSAFALSHGRDAQAGMLTAVAIAWKITPALFVIYFLFTRRWRALFGVVVGLFVCLVLIPSLLFGVRTNLHWLEEWSALVIQPFLSGHQVRSSNVAWHSTNQSLEAFVNRHLTPYGTAAYGGLHHVFDPAVLTEAQAHLIALVAKAAILLLLAYLATRSRWTSPRTLPLEISLLILGALFISPVSWFSHYVVVLVPYLVTLEEIRKLKEDGAPFHHLAIPLGLAVSASFLSLTAYWRSYSLVFLTQFGLFVALLAFTIRVQGLGFSAKPQPHSAAG